MKPRLTTSTVYSTACIIDYSPHYPPPLIIDYSPYGLLTNLYITIFCGKALRHELIEQLNANFQPIRKSKNNHIGHAVKSSILMGKTREANTTCELFPCMTGEFDRFPVSVCAARPFSKLNYPFNQRNIVQHRGGQTAFKTGLHNDIIKR